MKEKKLALQVSALCDGTVIDHIPADKLFAVVNLLNIQQMDTNVTIGFNLESKKLGKKGLIKIADIFFTDDEINRISLIAPNVIMNIIRHYEVVEKKEVKMPDEVHNLARCNNPVCITNNEPMSTHFHLVDRKKGILRCHYCNKEINVSDIELL